MGVNVNFHLCFSLSGARSCKGDSGGPLVCPFNGKVYQVGVVSFGDFECRAGTPCIYVKTAAYKRWIESTMNKFLNG